MKKTTLATLLLSGASLMGGGSLTNNFGLFNEVQAASRYCVDIKNPVKRKLLQKSGKCRSGQKPKITRKSCGPRIFDELKILDNDSILIEKKVEEINTCPKTGTILDRINSQIPTGYGDRPVKLLIDGNVIYDGKLTQTSILPSMPPSRLRDGKPNSNIILKIEDEKISKQQPIVISTGISRCCTTTSNKSEPKKPEIYFIPVYGNEETPLKVEKKSNGSFIGTMYSKFKGKEIWDINGEDTYTIPQLQTGFLRELLNPNNFEDGSLSKYMIANAKNGNNFSYFNLLNLGNLEVEILKGTTEQPAESCMENPEEFKSCLKYITEDIARAGRILAGREYTVKAINDGNEIKNFGEVSTWDLAHRGAKGFFLYGNDHAAKRTNGTGLIPVKGFREEIEKIDEKCNYHENPSEIFKCNYDNATSLLKNFNELVLTPKKKPNQVKIEYDTKTDMFGGDN